MKLEQRIVLITGGTSGIGLELAQHLLGRGNTVIVTGRDQDALNAAARTLSGVHTFRSDVGDLQAITALHEAVLARFPALDTLINNAGIIRNIRLNGERSLQDVTREVSASTPMCSFLQDRRVLVPCFSTSHSPAPQSFRPVLSTSKCKGSPSLRGCGRGTSSVSARRHKVEWSGTARSSPSRPMTEPIRPSV